MDNYNGLPLSELIVLAREGLKREQRLAAAQEARLARAADKLKKRQNVVELAKKALF